MTSILRQSNEKNRLSELAKGVGLKPPGGEKWKGFIEKRSNLFILEPISSSNPAHGYYLSLREDVKKKTPKSKGDDSKSKGNVFMLKGGVKCHVISSESDLDKVMQDDPILQGQTNKKREFVGFDCEGMYWRDFILIQVATKKGVYLIDVETLGKKLVFSKLRKLLTSETVVKSIHDVTKDAFFIQVHGKLCLSGVLDTQKAGGMIFGSHANRLGFVSLLQQLSISIPSVKTTMAKSMKRCKRIRGVPDWWFERPILQKYLGYAAWDALLALQVVNPIMEKLSNSELEDAIQRSNHVARTRSKAAKEHINTPKRHKRGKSD